MDTPPVSTGESQDEQSLLVSYLTLRRVVGSLGFFLPPLLVAAAHWHFQSSISAYYDLPHPRDVLVGTLFAIGFFLLTYRGYEQQDDICGYLCFGFSLGIALFPYDGGGVVGKVHYFSAAGMFLVLAYYSYFLFTKSSGLMTPEKTKRNRLYRVCGVVIALCIGIIAILGTSAKVDTPGTGGSPWVFWLESVALCAFGLSWLVKGETLWRDAGLPPRLRPAERRAPQVSD